MLISIAVIFSSFPAKSQEEGFEDITCEQAKTLIEKNEKNNEFVILDTRPKEMFNKGHLKYAIYYDVYAEGFGTWLDSLDKNKTYLVYCNAGIRSREACTIMHDKGFKTLYHMYEGIITWSGEKGYETISK